MTLNSYDEWSPLKEVVVGSAAHYTSHERELSFDLFFHDNIAGDNTTRSEWYYPRLTVGGAGPGGAGPDGARPGRPAGLRPTVIASPLGNTPSWEAMR